MLVAGVATHDVHNPSTDWLEQTHRLVRLYKCKNYNSSLRDSNSYI